MRIFFFYDSFAHLIYKQSNNSYQNKKNTKTGQNQKSSLLLLVNSKVKTKIPHEINFNNEKRIRKK